MCVQCSVQCAVVIVLLARFSDFRDFIHIFSFQIHNLPMEKFLVYGQGKVNQMLRLKLPSAKHFDEAKKDAKKVGDESAACLETVIFKAIKRQEDFGVSAHHQCLFGEKRLAFHNFLSKHPFPVSQGPVKLPLDCQTEEYKTSEEVMNEKTVFHHEDDQVCAEWLPLVSDTLAWGKLGKSYQVRDLKISVQGAASTRNMEIVYTCRKLQCAVYCPCFVCRDSSENCRMQMGGEKIENFS